MKLPNGYGSVYSLGKGRRKPWIARKTIGWSEEGKQLYYTIGYFEKRQDALTALNEYNKNPLGEKGDITLRELYEAWSKSRYSKLKKSTAAMYRTAWNHLEPIAEERVKHLKKSHFQTIIDGMTAKKLSRSSCHKVKVLAGLLLKEAMADDIINKNYAELVELPEDDSKKKDRFTDAEIKKISELAETDEWANTILILIYTGLRIGELLTITRSNVDIENMLITGGIKTEAGKNRVIPVHPKIQKYIQYWYDKGGDYLIKRNGNKILVNYYRKYLYYPTIEKAKVRKLSPHTTRHTFASLLNIAKANDKATQELMGHADITTTRNIYTHVNLDELRQAIESI